MTRDLQDLDPLSSQWNLSISTCCDLTSIYVLGFTTIHWDLTTIYPQFCTLMYGFEDYVIEVLCVSVQKLFLVLLPWCILRVSHTCWLPLVMVHYFTSTLILILVTSPCLVIMVQVCYRKCNQSKEAGAGHQASNTTSFCGGRGSQHICMFWPANHHLQQ